MKDYVLNFDLAPLNELDEFALLACQDYNFGNSTDWFGSFRGGIYAVSHRIQAVRRHFYEVHAWIPRPQLLETEYHLSTIFFNMDSALECLVFGINALGYAVDPSLFRDVTDWKALRAIKPSDIYGAQKSPLPGYSKYFPSLQKLWQTQLSLIDEICDLHDVSKHRQTIFVGGKARTDPPSGFFEAFGIPNDPVTRGAVQPMAEIFLKRDPKAPNIARKAPDGTTRLLEHLALEFATLINDSSRAILADAKSNIRLAHTSFKQNSPA